MRLYCAPHVYQNQKPSVLKYVSCARKLNSVSFEYSAQYIQVMLNKCCWLHVFNFRQEEEGCCFLSVACVIVVVFIIHFLHCYFLPNGPFFNDHNMIMRFSSLPQLNTTESATLFSCCLRLLSTSGSWASQFSQGDGWESSAGIRPGRRDSQPAPDRPRSERSDIFSTLTWTEE